MKMSRCSQRIVLCMLPLAWCGQLWADSSEVQNHIRRLLRWQRRAESPFLLLWDERLSDLYRMRRDEVLSPLRSALLDRAHTYSDPESPFYLGSAAWEAGHPLRLRQSTLPMIRYYCAALLDMGFAGYVEEGREIRWNGARLLLRTMNDIQSDFRIASATSASQVLVPASELLVGLTLAYDLLARSLDTKDREPFLVALEEERTFLASNVRRRMSKVHRPEDRIDIAACFGIATLFSSATSANRESRRSYQERYAEFVGDLIWATETLCRSWENLAADSQAVPLENLEYPAFYTVVFLETLRRIGGPDLLPRLPVGSIVTAVRNRRIPNEALVIDRTDSEPDPSAPDTWPPAIRSLFWNKGERPDTDVPTPEPTVKPTPTPTPRPILRFAQHLRAIRSKTQPPTPTPTPVMGWSPPCRGGLPSPWGPILLFLGRRGNSPAQEIWESGGELLSSHPATLAWHTEPRQTGRASRPPGPSVWLDGEGNLLVMRSSHRGDVLLAREVSEDGQSVGSFFIAGEFRRRILERAEVPAAGQVIAGTDTRLLSAGYVLSTQKRGGFEWTTVLRTPVSLGLPYVVSIVRASSNTVGTHHVNLPVESAERIEGGTSTPRFITLTYSVPAAPSKRRNRFPFSTGSNERHLRLLFSSVKGAQGQVVTEGGRSFLRAVQPLESGAAFVTLLTDAWKTDRLVVEAAELEEGIGVVIPWRSRGYDLIAVNTGKGIRGPTVHTDARLVVLSWDTTHDQVAYLFVDGTFLRATPSPREGSLRGLIDSTRGPVTVSWSGRSLVFADGCDIHGSYYAPGLRSASQGNDRLFAYTRNNRVTLSRRTTRTFRFHTFNADSNTR